jgi:hypothetical protein
MLLKLLSLPISLPIAGVRFCLDQVLEMAEAELMDDSAVREELLLLQLQLEEGEITEEEYVEHEAVLMQRLREIRAYREELQREQAEAAPDDDSGTRRRIVIETPFGDDD